MAESILGLLFEISADPAKAQAALAELKASTVAESTEISNVWGSAMNAVTGPAGIALGAVVGLGGGMLELANKAAESGAQIYEASKKTSLSAAELSGLRVVSKEVGESFDALTVSLGRFGVNIERGLGGQSKQASKDLLELFGSTKAVSELALLPMDKRIEAVTKRLFDMKDEAERNRIAADLFGRAWQTNFETFEKLGKEGLDPMIQKAKDLHQYYSDERAAEMKRFEERWNDLKTTFSGLANEIGSALVPAFTSLFAGFSQGSTALADHAEEWERITQEIEKNGAAVDNSGKTWTKADLEQRKLTQATEEWHPQPATSTDALQKQTQQLNISLAGWKGHVEVLGLAKPALKDVATGTKQAGDALETAADKAKKFWDALASKNQPNFAEGFFPKLTQQVDAFGQALARLAQEAQSKELQQLIAMTTGAGGLGLPAFGASGVDPFGKMAQSLNQAIVPFTNFDKLFKELIKDIPAVTLQGDKFATESSRWIQQVGLMSESMTLLKNTGTQVFTSLAQAMGQTAANALVYGKNFGAAMEQALKSTLASVAGQAVVRALFETGSAFADLAIHDYPDAALHFQAAGLFGIIGGVAGGAGAAIPGGGGGSSGGARTGGGKGVPFQGSSTITPRGAGGAGAGGGTQVIVNIEGVMSTDTLDILGPSIAGAVASAVQQGQSTAFSGMLTNSRPNVTRGG
jgi:hypothetical protein